MASQKFIKVNDYYCQNTENGKYYNFSEVVQMLNDLVNEKNEEM